MNFQKFVAWEKTPSLIPDTDAKESSSSSSKAGSLEENESEIFPNVRDMDSEDDLIFSSFIEIPHTVKNVLNKIDTAQLERAKKDISKKLHHIKEKVHRAYEHYKKDDPFDSELEKEYLRIPTWEEKTRRSNLLDEITDSLEEASFKEKELEMVLESLKAWSEMMKIIELQEKVIPRGEWIDEAEKSLLKRFHAIQQNILQLIKMCYPLVHEREKMRRRSAIRTTMFKAWKEKVAEKPDLEEPLTAEQMVEDEVLTFSLTNEINEMILELAEVSVFNKGEVSAIKYIAAMVANLTKAFGILNRQCRSLKFKLEVGASESRKHDPQITSLQRELRMIIEKKAALEMQVQKAEERCKILLTTNEAMQKELRNAHERAQMSRTSPSRPASGRVPQETAKTQEDVEKSVSKMVVLKQLQSTASRMSVMAPEEFSSLGDMRKLKYQSQESDTEKMVEDRDKMVSVDYMTQSQTPLARDTPVQRVTKVQEKELASQITQPKETAPLGKKPHPEFPIEKVTESTPKLKGNRASTAPQDSELQEKTKLQKPQLAVKSVTEGHLSQSSGAGSQDSPQEKTSEREPSPESPAEIVHTPSIKEDIDSSAEKRLPELPTKEAQPPSIQLDGQITELKPSIKGSAKTAVEDTRSPKRVKFQGGISAEVPLTAPDSSEKSHAELPEGSPLPKPLTGIAEDVESESQTQDAGKMKAQEQQIGRLKEKEEMKDLGSIPVQRPTDVSERGVEESEQTKIIIRDVIHNLGTQLQEIARKKGGVIEAETIKKLFEDVESESQTQDAGKMQAQKLQIGRLKENEEMKDLGSTPVQTPTDVSERGVEESKQTKIIIRDAIHDLGTQLQEIARKKGGVIEAETIKKLFEELDITSEDDISEQTYGSLPADKLTIVIRPELHTSTSEQLSKFKESTDEVSSSQDMKSVMQEFQGSILACIEDKMEKLKIPSESLKQPEKSKPLDPQVQHLYQAIDKKLDECFSAMKHKYKSAIMRQRVSSLGIEEDEKEIKLPSSLVSLSVLSQESSSTSLSLSEEGGEQQISLKHRKLSKERLKHLRKVQAVFQDQQKQPEKKEDSSKYPYPKEEKRFHLPEVVLRVLEEKRQVKESKHAKKQSLQEPEQGLWALRLQDRLEWEKERLKEEQLRLQDERLRLDEEEKYLEHWQRLFETQQEQWHQRQQQQQSQEMLWEVQFDYWQQQKQDHEQQQQYWQLQQEKHQERLHQLQEELQKLQRQYEQQVLLQKEQTEEQGRWEQLQAAHEEQLRAWKAEDEEREKQRGQWQQQLEDHEKQLRAWQQEKAEQQLQYKESQEMHREQLQGQENLWQQTYEQQQQQLQHQVQRHRTQQHKQQTQLQKVRERQKQIGREEKLLAPQLKMLKARVQKELAKEVQWTEPKELAPQLQMMKTRVQGKLDKEVPWTEARELAPQPKMMRTRIQGELAKDVQRQELSELAPQPKMMRTRVQGELAKDVQRQELSELAPQPKIMRARVQEELAQEVQWQESIKPEPPTHKVQPLPAAHTDDLLPATHTTGLLPTTPQITPESSQEYLDFFDLDSTSFSKLFPQDDGFPASGVTERRYSLNVEAQRKNLELLEEAYQKAGLASDLYIKAKETITQVLHSNVERLALLFRKYIAFCRLKEIRRIINTWLDAAKVNKDGATMKKLYKTVERFDVYQNRVLANWTSGQKIVEKKRQHNIKNMIALFDQVNFNCRLQLDPPCPLTIKAIGPTKETQLMPRIGPVYLRPKVYRSPLFAMKKPIAFSAIVRDENSEQLESLWRTDITELSIPVGPKTPVSLLWSQPCGFPEIPRLLEFDITSLRNKPLQEIKTRIQSVPRWKLSNYKFMHL